jgi:hypothetical protein
MYTIYSISILDGTISGASCKETRMYIINIGANTTHAKAHSTSYCTLYM